MLRMRIVMPRAVRSARRMVRGVGMNGMGSMLVKSVVVVESESVRRP